MAISDRLPRLSQKKALVGTLALVSGAALVVLPIDKSIELIGNASFAATFLSYAQSDIIRLRLIAIASLCMGLVYNTYVHLQMPEGQGIALVIFWLGVFLVQNVAKAVREVSQSIEASLDPELRQLLAASFPSMHSKDWLQLMQAAHRREAQKQEVLLDAGASTTTLMLLASGSAVETRIDGLPPLVRQPGTFWGELTWSLGRERYNKSPCAVTVTSETAHILEWSYDELDALTRDNPRMLAALRDGFLRSACFKHGLLQARTHDLEPIWQERLTIA